MIERLAVEIDHRRRRVRLLDSLQEGDELDEAWAAGGKHQELVGVDGQHPAPGQHRLGRAFLQDHRQAPLRAEHVHAERVPELVVRSQHRAVGLRHQEVDRRRPGPVVVDDEELDAQRSIVLEEEGQEVVFVPDDGEDRGPRGRRGDRLHDPQHYIVRHRPSGSIARQGPYSTPLIPACAGMSGRG